MNPTHFRVDTISAFSITNNPATTSSTLNTSATRAEADLFGSELKESLSIDHSFTLFLLTRFFFDLPSNKLPSKACYFPYRMKTRDIIGNRVLTRPRVHELY